MAPWVAVSRCSNPRREPPWGVVPSVDSAFSSKRRNGSK